MTLIEAHERICALSAEDRGHLGVDKSSVYGALLCASLLKLHGGLADVSTNEELFEMVQGMFAMRGVAYTDEEVYRAMLEVLTEFYEDYAWRIVAFPIPQLIDLV